MNDYAILIGSRIQSVRIPLVNRITILTGESGSGKTKTIELTGAYVFNKEYDVHVESNLPVVIYSKEAGDIVDTLKDEQRKLIFIDEDVATHYKNKLAITHHKVLLITRGRMLWNFVDINDVYYVNFRDVNNLTIQKLYSQKELYGVYDYVITEADNNKSENTLITKLLPEIGNVVAGRGRDNIANVIDELDLYNTRVLVFLDTGAGALFLDDIYDAKSERSVDITIVPYTSFEALLYWSKLTQSLPNTARENKLNLRSSEMFYEHALQKRTAGTKIRSKHAEFSECFIKQCTSCCELHQSSTLLKTLFSTEGLPLLRWYWQTYHPDWIQLSNEIIETLKHSYNPNGFMIPEDFWLTAKRI